MYQLIKYIMSMSTNKVTKMALSLSQGISPTHQLTHLHSNKTK